jgi:hypothetical protein
MAVVSSLVLMSQSLHTRAKTSEAVSHVRIRVSNLIRSRLLFATQLDELIWCLGFETRA